MLKKIMLGGMLCVMTLAHAGKKFPYLGIALNNFVTAKPVTGFPKLFYSQFHPGITLSTGFNWTEKPKHNIMQSFKATYFSHRYIQRSIILYAEIGYRYKPGRNWGFSVALGGGYLHMIPAEEQFRQDDNGNWKKMKLKSRPQAAISLSLGIDKRISSSGIRGFIRYQNLLQTPFIPGYVPLLPYNVLHLGITVPTALIRKGGKSEK